MFKSFLLLTSVLILMVPQWTLSQETNRNSINTELLQDVGFMNNDKLERILKEETVIMESRPGYWQINFNQRPMLVITDENNNRMRIMSPVIEIEKIPQSQYIEILEAQFDRALDVKYAISEDILWSVYIHPLKELTSDQLTNAIEQVFLAAQNYGNSYRSTGLEYGSGEDDSQN